MKNNAQLWKELSKCDKSLSDLLHLAELTHDFNRDSAYELLMKIKKVLIERRKIKRQLGYKGTRYRQRTKYGKNF